ncbi:MAG: right-handed parallel beta-helix repeat-containing protein, partial [Methanothrix sp.]|nr:right-handed parallel beta-helix repeat-containing protein [Methanothrix sp.]
MLKKIIIMICILSGIVQAADIQVGCRDCDYSSIQEAIDHSKEGDRIEVFSGVYPNDIIINVDNISLIGVDTGNGKPVIYANSVNIQPIPCSDIRGLKGASVQINGDNVTLKNFNIIKKPTPNSGDIIYFGLAVTSKGNIITDNEISNYTFGILLCRSSNNLICKNKIKDNKKMGIHLANSSKNVIVCNGVEGSDHNIDLDDKSLSNLIYFNYLDNPGKFNAYDPGKFNSNLWNNSTIGNFYSHFECISDCSGICSNEYKIPPGSNVDKHPVSNDILSSQKLFICQPLHCLNFTVKANCSSARVGETIGYTIDVSNCGRSQLKYIRLYDEKIGLVSYLSGLNSGEARKIESPYTHKVNESDLPGPFNIKFNATYFCVSCGEYKTDHAEDQVPLVNVVFNKTPDLEMAHVGDRINYGYDIINKGSAELHNLSIWDNKTGNFTPVRTTLGEGETTHANSVYTVKKMDCPAVINEAILYYQDRENKNRSISANASVPTIKNISISISKKANRTLAEVGDNITYYYEIRNTGNVTFNNLTLNDSKIDGVVPKNRTLKPNESTTAEANYLVLEEDLPVLINEATARGWDNSG